jgi:hypothetical protein
MSPTISQTWAALGASVTGASHRRAGRPNQDAVLFRLTDDGALPAVLAVSDGHGSEKCFRSHIGSQLAVAAAAAELTAFSQSLGGQSEDIDTLAVQHLPAAIVQRWRESVLRDYAERPFQEEELANLSSGARRVVESGVAEGRPFIAYGATLLAALVTTELVVYLQIGDGEILAVAEKDGGVLRPIEGDATLIADETTSLCQEQACDQFRVRYERLTDSMPVLIMLATDGYANSFETPEGFRQVAADLRRAIQTEGVPAVNEALPGWLDEASELGSGDDISVAILCRTGFSVVPACREEPLAQPLQEDA